MRNIVLTYIDGCRQNRRERLVRGSVFAFLAVIVSFAVYWQLRYTGITMVNETFCGYEEHIHGESCYDEAGSLTCGLEAHTHTAACAIDLNADVEDAEIWKATLPTLTEEVRTDVVNIAYSQLGYTESTANYSIGDDGETRYGYTRYGAWYGNEYGTWDAMFVSFCLNYADVDKEDFPFHSGAYSWAVELSESGAYFGASDYIPTPGDLIFFDTDQDERVDRVGIVVLVEETTVTVIEGDYSDEGAGAVALTTYDLTDTVLSGYGILPAQEETDGETDSGEGTETEAETPVRCFTASDSGVAVTVIAPEGALPDNATLSVSLLDEESEEYAAAAEAVGYASADTEGAANAISEDGETEESGTALAVLDICFTVDGVEVEPAEAVTVIIDASSLMTEDADASTLEVQHLEQTEEGVTPVLVADATDETEGTVDAETAVAEFTVEGFSSFTLRWSYGNNSYKAVTVNVYDTDGEEISSTEYTFTYSSSVTQTTNWGTTYCTIAAGTEVDLTALLTIEGYTFDHAEVMEEETSWSWSNGGWVQTTTYTTIDNDASTIKYTRNGNNGNNSYYTIDGERNYTLDNNSTVVINLYYRLASASLTVNKYETGTTTQLSGAGFTLTNTSGESLASVTVSGGTVLTQSGTTITFTTSDSGITFTDLPDGSYTLTETSPPSGYETAATFEFTVTSNALSSSDSRYDSSSRTVTIYDAPQTAPLTIEKSYSVLTTDVDVSQLSATFTLTSTDTDCTNESITITGAGSGTFAIHLHDGTYTLTESTVPAGFDTPDAVTIEVKDGKIYVGGEETSTIPITNKQTASLTITDNIITKGEFAATLTVGSTTVDLTDTRYTVTWYKSGYTFDSSYNSENLGVYSEVTNTLALGDDPSTVNVAIDSGGLCYYYVTVYDSETGVTYESDVEHVPYAAELLNSSFEWNSSGTQGQSAIPFWSTTASTGNIEIGAYINPTTHYGTQNIYAGGSVDTAGNNFAELNADSAGALYQDVLTIGGEALNWSLYHRARTADGGSWQGSNSTDEMYVVIMSTEDAEKLLAGVDQTNQQSVLTAMITGILGSASNGSGNYTLQSGTYANTGTTVSATIWTVSSTNSFQEGEWNYNSGEYTVPAEQYVTRFFFVSKSSGYSSTNYTVGNLIDYATFSQNITYVIEYWTVTDSGSYELRATETGSAYPLTNVYASRLSEFSDYGLVGSVTGTSSGGANPTFDSVTTTGMRVTSNTRYLSLYLGKPVVTVVKVIDGLSESEIDELLKDETYTVTFTIEGGGETQTLTLPVGATGTASGYTTKLTTGTTYTISEDVTYTGSFLDDYDLTVTVAGNAAKNGIGGDYEFTPTDNTSLTITFTNTYTKKETYTGGREMPETGGRGTFVYTVVGVLLMSGAGYLMYRKRKRICQWRWNI